MICSCWNPYWQYWNYKSSSPPWACAHPMVLPRICPSTSGICSRKPCDQRRVFREAVRVPLCRAWILVWKGLLGSDRFCSSIQPLGEWTWLYSQSSTLSVVRWHRPVPAVRLLEIQNALRHKNNKVISNTVAKKVTAVSALKNAKPASVTKNLKIHYDNARPRILFSVKKYIKS